MNVEDLLTNVSLEFQADQKDLQSQIKKLKESLEKNNKKKSFKALSSKERYEGTLRSLQMELLNKIQEMEEFQARFKEIIKLPDAYTLVEREINILNKHLPVYRFRRTILESIQEKDVTILVADTGSGKSTMLTQFLYSQNEETVVYCCQPRKIAATSLANYTNTCLGLDPQNTIVATDFNEWETTCVPGVSRIVYTTNFGLLSKWRSDKQLEGIDVVIIDETHERTLSIDLLLGIMKEIHCQSRKRPIKTVIMSATIDPSIFSDYFESSKISTSCISIPGKTFPVELIHDSLPLSQEPGQYVRRAVDKVMHILKDNKIGDILVFLATPMEIEEASDYLKDELSLNSMGKVPQVFPLHGGVEMEDRKKLLLGNKDEQRVILSTNIAETSLTLPGIRFVIDSGRQKEFVFDLERNVGSLSLASISKSSALQRMGRAGRTCPGVCYRLYMKEDFDSFPSGRSPEILSLPSDQALLSLFYLGFSTPHSFDFIQPPSPEVIELGLQTLLYLGAIKIDEESYVLTDHGLRMAKLNLTPKISHMVIRTLSSKKDLLIDVLIIAGVLSAGDSIFYRSTDFLLSKIRNFKFCDEKSDFLTMIKAFKAWYHVPIDSRNKWCRENFISSKTMTSVIKFIFRTSKQLEKIFKTKLQIGSPTNLYLNNDSSFCDDLIEWIFPSFRRSLAVFSGHPMHGYINCSNGEVMALHPSCSIVCTEIQPLELICYDKVMKTSRTFIFTASLVKKEWLDEEEIKQIMNEHVQRNSVAMNDSYSRLGRQTLGKFVCPKMKMLRESFKEKVGASEATNFLDININFQLGTLTSWCHTKHLDIAKTLIESLLDTAREEAKAMETVFSPQYATSFYLKLGSGGRILEIVDLDNLATLHVSCVKKDKSFDALADDIEDFLSTKEFKFTSKKMGGELRISFMDVNNGFEAKELLHEQFTSLELKWSQTWNSFVNYNIFRRGTETDDLSREQKTLDDLGFQECEATLLPYRDGCSAKVKVTAPTVKMCKQIHTSLNCFDPLLFYKKSVTIPTKFAQLLKIYEDSSIRLYKKDDDLSTASILERDSGQQHARHFYGTILDTLRGSLLVLDVLSPFFILALHAEEIEDIERARRIVITDASTRDYIALKIFATHKNIITHAKADLERYFEGISKTHITIPFDQRRGHRGVLPTLLKAYGSNFHRLSRREGISRVNVNHESSIFEISGDEGAMEEIGKEIKDLLARECEALSDDACVECGENYKQTTYRFQLCGHKVCYGKCIQSIALSSNVLPLRCPSKDCGQELTALDIKAFNFGDYHLETDFYYKLIAQENLAPGVLRCSCMGTSGTNVCNECRLPKLKKDQ